MGGGGVPFDRRMLPAPRLAELLREIGDRTPDVGRAPRPDDTVDDLQVTWLDLELVCRDAEELVAGLGDRRQHGGS